MKKMIRLVCMGVLGVLLMLPTLPANAANSIVFGDAGWDSMRFHNAVAMLVAQEAYGYQTEMVSGSTAITYNALIKGDVDVYMETWTDSIAPYASDVAQGRIVELGVNYADNKQGFYVPRYVIEGDAQRGIEPMAAELKTVADLQHYSQVFSDPEEPRKGRIFGAISGWEVDEVMRRKVAFYGLDAMYNYIDPGSDAALAAAIAGAYEKGEPIVAYYWEPAWITGKYDLVLLEDAPYDSALYLKGECECPSIRLTVAVNPAFYQENPEFSEFLSRYQTSSELTSQALAYLSENSATYEETAKWFIAEHPELLDQWLSLDQAEAVRRAL